MPDSLFWRDLAGDFEKLPLTIFVQWHFTSGSPGNCRYSIEDDSQLLRVKFEQLARKAGVALAAHREKDPVDLWLDELRTLDKDPRNRGELFGPEMVGGNQVYHRIGKIPNAAEASACRCIELQMDAERLAEDGVLSKASEIDNPVTPAPRAIIPGAKSQSRKRGPKADYDTAEQVAQIVKVVSPDGNWPAKFDEVCAALDRAEIPIPKVWRKKDKTCKEWSDHPDRPVVVKAIDYRIKIARQRARTSPETLS